MQYNPYEYMLEIRDNRVLFQYLENSAVHFSDQNGWTITGESKEGRTEIYQLASGVLRFSLPISVPNFVTMDILQRILEGLQGNIEGLVTPAEEDGVIFIEYHIHSTEDLLSLDKALLKFLEERAEINKGFESLTEEYERMQKAMGSISEGLAAAMGKMDRPKSSGSPASSFQPDEPDLSSLWNDMENIDSKDDNNDGDGPDDVEPTAPAQ